MELVTSYKSEVDEMDISKIPAAAPKTALTSKTSTAQTSKTIDVIELDSDSDTDCVSSIEKDRSTTAPACSKELGTKSRTVDCIDLENYDGATKLLKAKQNKQQNISPNKKIDYLNLESSDSEDEKERADRNMCSLKESASVLSSIPYGPLKPTEAKEKLPACNNEKDLSNIVSLPNITTNVNSSSATKFPDFSEGNTSRDSLDSPGKKRFRGNNSQNEVEGPAAEKNLSIYREDERAIEATKKNVVCRIPRQVIQTHEAHSNIITSLSWCIPKYSYLFLSSSLDGSIKIWDLYKLKPVQCVKAMTRINAAKWSLDGGQIVAGGHKEKAFVLDVETGKEIIAYDIYNIVTSMEIHPYMEDVFLCGTRNAILGFDIRVNSPFPIRSFFSKCEEVLDIAFLDENEFICSTSIVSHDSSDRTIMAWDFSSGAILSNQIYLERFTCPSLKVHPTDSIFVAQSNGNYIVSFSTSRPYKKKGLIYMGHKVSGYGIECDISPDGKYLATGDADGNVYYYNFATANSVHCADIGKKVATNRVRWHPTFSNTLITASYDGRVQIWK